MRLTVRFVVVLCLVSVHAVASPSVSDVIARYRDARLGEAKKVANFQFRVGHADITAEGVTVSPLIAGDQTVGLFIDGPGTFTYESLEKDEFTALSYNAKHGGLTVKTGEDRMTVTERFSNVLLWGNGLPEIDGEPHAAPEAAYAAHRELFARHYAPEPAHLFALQALNAPDARVVRAQINGTEKPYVYVYDDAWSREEELTHLRRPQWRTNADKNWFYSTPVSAQPIGRSSRAMRPANVMLTDVDLTLVNTDKDDATLTVTETIVPQRRAAGALRFSLYSDYYFDINRTPRRYNVRRITDEQGNELSFSHDNGELIVALAKPAPAGKPLKLRFDIDGDFLYRPEGSNYWELGIEPWFPWVEMHEQSYTFRALVKVKKPFVPFVSGTTVRRAEEGEHNVLETKIERPVSWVAVLAGRYHFDEETKNGVTVRVASFMSKNAMAYKQLRNIAFAAIEQFPHFLGEFPFNEINLIEKSTPFPYGQAPAGIVFITSEAFSPKRGDVNQWVGGVNMRLAHEIAHQYWGEIVKMPSFEEQWIDEAFAEYSAALLLEQLGLKKYSDRAFAEWSGDAKEAAKVAIIPMANRLRNPGDPVGAAMTRQGLIYAKGSYLLAAIHREVGDQMFLTFLKSYQKSMAWKFGTTEDVVNLLKIITKKDYGPFFEQYYYGTALPPMPKKK